MSPSRQSFPSNGKRLIAARNQPKSAQISCCSSTGSLPFSEFSSSLVIETMNPSISRCSFSASSANICALEEISSFAANCCSVAALVDCASSDACIASTCVWDAPLYTSSVIARICSMAAATVATFSLTSTSACLICSNTSAVRSVMTNPSSTRWLPSCVLVTARLTF